MNALAMRRTLFIRLVGIRLCGTTTFVLDGEEDRFILQDFVVRILRRPVGVRALMKLLDSHRLRRVIQGRRVNYQWS
jgi:hypothetical protein